MSATVIEAAGAVLWRVGARPSSAGEIEIGLIHRPRYDEWSVPKGKLDQGEHPLLAAVREVREETGLCAPLGRPLGEVHYKTRGRPKRVRYWAMQIPDSDGAGSPRFVANDEADELRWVPVAEAVELMPAGHDQPVVHELARDPRPTRAVIVVRHASAGSRKRWKGPDGERPLDPKGRRQAERLAGLIGLYGVTRAYSADTRRCLETVAPFAAKAGVPVQEEPLLSEDGYRADPDAAQARLTEIVCCPHASVVSTQRKSLPALIGTLAALGQQPPVEVTLGKGAFVVLHVALGTEARLVALEPNE